jgi:spore germination protein GerM
MRRLPLLLAVALAACGGEKKPAEATPVPGMSGNAPGGAQDMAPAPRVAVTLLWPSAGAAGLVPRNAEIFATSSPVDRAKQVLGLLLAPPPERGLLSPLPGGTRVEVVFLDASGTATVSLSREAVDKAHGGSAWEIAAVNSVVGSLVRSVPQIKRVRILVAGQQVETLTGHLDLTQPLVLDARSLAP